MTTIIVVGIWFVVATTSIDCLQTSLTNERSEEISEFAKDSVLAMGREFELEDKEIETCSLDLGRQLFPPITGTDRSILSGYFPGSAPNPDSSVRDRLLCEIRRRYVDEALVGFAKHCQIIPERTLSFPGIESLVRVDESVTFDEAREFLKFVANLIGKEVHGRLFRSEDVESIMRISGRASGEVKRFDAFKHYDYGVRVVSAKRSLDGEAVFELADGR